MQTINNDELYMLEFKQTLYRIGIALPIFLATTLILSTFTSLISFSIPTEFSDSFQQSIRHIIVSIALFISGLSVVNFSTSKLSTTISLKFHSKTFLYTFMTLGVTFFSNILINIISLTGVNLPNPPAIKFDNSPLGIVFFVISIAVFPAIFEEFLCRGTILGSLKKYNNSFAIIVSTIFFSLLHANITQIIITFITGIMLAYITLKSGSIFPAMLAHFLNNFIYVLEQLIKTNISVQSASFFLSFVTISIITIGVYSTISLHKSEGLKLEKAPLTTAIPRAKIFSAIISNPGIIISCILFIIYLAFACK